METVIKIKSSELDSHLVKRIKSLIGRKKNIEVEIAIHETDSKYAKDLNESIDQARGNVKLKIMTLEEFLKYTPQNSPIS